MTKLVPHPKFSMKPVELSSPVVLKSSAGIKCQYLLHNAPDVQSFCLISLKQSYSLILVGHVTIKTSTSWIRIVSPVDIHGFNRTCSLQHFTAGPSHRLPVQSDGRVETAHPAGTSWGASLEARWNVKLWGDGVQLRLGKILVIYWLYINVRYIWLYKYGYTLVIHWLYMVTVYIN